MKVERFRFLSARIIVLIAALTGLSGGLLLAAAVRAIRGEGSAAGAILGGLAFFCILYLAYRLVYLPCRETRKVLQLFAGGYTVQGIYDLRYPVCPEMDDALGKIHTLLNTNELISATKKQAQYLALQNQINPHFLYNTLEGIRGEALTAGLDHVAQMTEALATFFRYTISNVEHLVSLEEELRNVETYYLIQEYRFGERLNLCVEYDSEDREELLAYKLPKLTLQPIVENAIFHGIERKIGRGTIRVKLESTAKRLIITVSDNGLGMEESRLRELNEKLKMPAFDYVKPDSERQGGIAIVNVNNRIRLLFGEEYGINIDSTLHIGTDVEITLPLLTKDIGK